MSQKYEQNQESAPPHSQGEGQSIEFLQDISLGVTLEFGRAEITIGKLLGLKKGSVIELGRSQDEPLCFYANGKCVARGEVVVVNENYGVRITSIETPLGFEDQDT